MDETVIPGTNDAVVIGAGLAGLAAALLLAQRGRCVVVLDGGVPGGRARSDTIAGHPVNRGPRAVYDHGDAARVLRGLGVSWTGHPPSTAVGWLRVGGDVVPMPSGTGKALLSRMLSVRDKVALGRFLGSLGKADPPVDVSAHDWFVDRGLSGRALDMVQMLTRVSTYSGDLTRLSADAAVAQLQLGLRGVTYVDGGWQSLVDDLGARCARGGVRIEHHRPVLGLAGGPGAWRVELSDGVVGAAAVVIAAGGPAEARRLLRTDPWGDLGPAVTAACLDVVVPSGGEAGAPVLFSLDDPLYLSRHTPSVVHVARYGARSADEDRAELMAHAAVAGLDVDGATSRFLARMVVAHTAPSPAHGGLPGRPSVDVPGWEGVTVAGDWVGGGGMLADAALASASEAAASAERTIAGAAHCRVR